jgi:hypothetical protein
MTTQRLARTRSRMFDFATQGGAEFLAELVRFRFMLSHRNI